ncbi:MAG: tyrosine-type recombinase/integrase [Mycobacterium sp.]|nr:tyrosine-type recombinase/integrase [Mycobacterium sp.]
MATISKYQTASGATFYRVRYRTPDHRQTDKRGFKTKRDASAFATEVESRKLRGEYVSPALGKAAIGELGEAWLERQKGHLKPNSYKSVEVSWRVHLKPHWARWPVSEVMPSDIKAWVAELAQRRGAKVVRAAHAVMFSILEDAKDDGRIGSNPATKTDNLPEITKRPNVYLTGEQLHALARESGRYRSLVLLLGTAGLRWGEAVSLRVADVQDRRLVIHKNATGGTTGTPKGGDHRTLVLAQYVVDELAITVAGKADSDLIWPSQTGGHLKPPGSHDSWLSGAVRRCQRIAEAARIAEQKAEVDRKLQTPVFPRITAHDLRHTAASLAVQSGANVKVIQRMLGHKSAAMTLDVYADLFDDDLTAAADKLDQSVGKLWAPALKLVTG